MALQAKFDLDPEALSRRLNVRARARADAAAGRPAADARDLAAVERDIAAAAAQERARIDHARAERQAECERALRALAPTPVDIASPIADARLALRQVEGRVARSFAAASQRARRDAGDLESFRRAHALRRAAHYPNSRLLQAGMLLAAAVFESLFSATLFAESDDRGLLGGAVTAIGLSGANVTLGFLAGFLGLRYLQHVQPLQKTLGALAFALLGGLAMFLNLFAALWRQQLASGAAAPMLDAGNSLARIASFFGDAFSLTEPQAIILLMLGGGVWVFSTLKGYSGFDDPYPDYGKLARAARDAEEEETALREDLRDDLEAPLDEAKARIAASLDASHAAIDAMAKVYDEAAAAIGALDAQARRVDDAVSALIQLYRQENTAARRDPAPPYFSDPPPGAGPPRDALTQAGALMAAARAAHAEAQAEAARGREALLAELDAIQARLDQAREA